MKATPRFFLIAAAAMLTIPTGAIQTKEPPSIVGTYPLHGISGATGWINSPPLTAKQLKGKVVLVDFWDYSCINCIRNIPYTRAWADKYEADGLVVIGVHTPEFDFEKDPANVEKAVKKFGITYPVALDSDNKVWDAFHNQYWPAAYFIDAKGKVRYQHFGEGNYDESEKWIEELLKEANPPQQSQIRAPHGMPRTPRTPEADPGAATGVQAAPDVKDVHSPETYIGYARAEHFASPGGIKPEAETLYTAPTNPALNEWGFAGQWEDHEQDATLKQAGGKIIFHFHARDLHLVLGPSADGKPVHFQITIDGQTPGESHGVDTDAQGNGVVTGYRLYQLVRQKGAITDHIFTIEFKEPGVRAFSFTFG
jgi:thiol-disulfide isomerase/thioredoxin